MKIYEQEKLDGIDLNSESTAQLSILTDLDKDKKFAKSDYYYESNNIKDLDKSHLSSDLALVHGLLVTTNWNKNDDVFSPIEVWLARNSPVFKPANMDHLGQESDKSNNTLGVIKQTYPVDDDYRPIILESDNLSNLPHKFHLLIGILLWEKYFPKTVKNIKDGIAAGTMFISMECFFMDFGYALRETNSDKINLLPRNEQTAWLTKYLRSYRGEGKVLINNKEYRIGRWLRELTFSGVAFVKNPANPESILFEDYVSHASNNLEFQEIFASYLNEIGPNCVLNINDQKVNLWPNQI